MPRKKPGILRPRGVGIITAWVGVLSGIAPVTMGLLAYMGAFGSDIVIPIRTLAYTLPSGAAIFVVALFAWRGMNWARYTLVALIEVGWGWNAYAEIEQVLGEAGSTWHFWGAGVDIAITTSLMLFVAWYMLMSPAAKRFYAEARSDRLARKAGKRAASTVQ